MTVAPQTTQATCHCGAVVLSILIWPNEVTNCNCSFCRKSGVLWAYYQATDILALPDPAVTETYAWNGRYVDFHRCRTCGCLTHWVPRAVGRNDKGVNANLFPPDVLEAARVRHRDGAGTGKQLD